jgi:hypothetical protein
MGFRSLHEALDTTTPGGCLAFHVLAALTEFIRELIVQGTHKGFTKARTHGQRIGRPPAMTDEQVPYARTLFAHPDNAVTPIREAARRRGSYARSGRHLPAPAVDTNGAGDAFASGFLFGWLAGESPLRCGLCGAVVAAHDCTVPSTKTDHLQPR